jgi:hypothetical protein
VAEETGVGAVGPGQFQPTPGGAREEDGPAVPEPLPAEEAAQEWLVQPPRRPVVDVLRRGRRQPEAGLLEEPG